MKDLTPTRLSKCGRCGKMFDAVALMRKHWPGYGFYCYNCSYKSHAKLVKRGDMTYGPLPNSPDDPSWVPQYECVGGEWERSWN